MEYKNHPNFDFHFPRHFILNSNFYVQNIEDNEKLMRITFPKKKTDKKDTCKPINQKIYAHFLITKCLSFIKRWFATSRKAALPLLHFATISNFSKKKPISSAHQSSTKAWKGNICVRTCWGCRNWSMHYAYRN